MTKEQYRQFKAYATQYGTFVGLMWVTSFACYIGGFSAPFLSTLCLFLGITSPLLAIYLGKRFRRDACEGFISFGRALWFALLMFFYATLLTTIVQYIYFRFIDNGFLFSAFETLLQQPEVKESLNSMLSTMELENVTDILSSITPSQLTFNMLTFNMFAGMILSFPVALAVMRRLPQGGRVDIRSEERRVGKEC